MKQTEILDGDSVYVEWWSCPYCGMNENDFYEADNIEETKENDVIWKVNCEGCKKDYEVIPKTY